MKVNLQNSSFSYSLILLIIFFCIPVELSSQNKWYKGNLHCHTRESDGLLLPDTLLKRYKSKGYDFVSITDHYSMTDKKKNSTSDFIILNGQEVTFQNHLSAIGINHTIVPPQLNNTSVQSMLDSINAQNSLPIINHPLYFDSVNARGSRKFTLKRIFNLKNINHMEIFNGTGRGNRQDETFQLWDEVLTAGIKLFGTASDDAHHSDEIGTAWIMISAPTLSESNIITALRKGEFYSSTGIYIKEINISNNNIFISSSNGTTIKFISKHGKVLKIVENSEAEYTLQWFAG